MAGDEETSLKGGLGGDRSGTVGTKDQDVRVCRPKAKNALTLSHTISGR